MGFKIHMEMQGIQNRQNNLEKEEQKLQNSHLLQTLPKSYSNQDNIVLV